MDANPLNPFEHNFFRPFPSLPLIASNYVRIEHDSSPVLLENLHCRAVVTDPTWRRVGSMVEFVLAGRNTAKRITYRA